MHDLTPADARAEVEAFMGESWAVQVYVPTNPVKRVVAVTHPNGVAVLRATASTYRAAVDALKAAWRDAVRPWVVLAADRADMECGFGATDGNTRERLVARVLKEDGNNG